MSDMAMTNGNGVPSSAAPDSASQVAAMLHAMQILAGQAAMDTSAAEAKDRAQACLAFAQAIIVLDPTLNQQGIPLEHEVALKAMEIDGQERLAKAKAAAAAQAPAKRKLSIRRDASGRMADAEIEG